MGQIVIDSKENSQILVEQFQSVFTHDDDQQIPETKKGAMRPISPLRMWCWETSPWYPYNQSRRTRIMSKTCACQLAPALITVFQRSIDSWKHPSDWLNANISPVYQKGDVHLPENYRPVSLTYVSCKILERITYKHILDHIEQNKILTTLNHGFRSGYFFEIQLVRTVHDLLGRFDIGSQIDMVILNFSKFFCLFCFVLFF